MRNVSSPGWISGPGQWVAWPVAAAAPSRSLVLSPLSVLYPDILLAQYCAGQTSALFGQSARQTKTKRDT